jgi:hypothetical protein
MEPPVSCPVCGAWSLTQDGQSSALLAVADVLCLKALEKIGSRLIRKPRGRHAEFAGRPLYLAHTVWQTDDETVALGLKGAWDVVPAMLDGHGWPTAATSQQIATMLDDYVHDLVVTGTAHNLGDLAYRFTDCLGLPVYLHGTVTA